MRPLYEDPYGSEVSTGQRQVGKPVEAAPFNQPTAPPPSWYTPPPVYSAGPSVASFGGGNDYGLRQVDPGLANLGSDTNGKIQSYLDSILNGGQTRWSPEVMTAAKVEAKSASRGSAVASKEAYRSDLARTGQFRSPYTARGYVDIENNAAKQYNSAVNQLTVQKANADFEDKLAALDRMEKFLQDTRSHVLAVTSLGLDRDKAIASLTMAQMNLSFQRESLQSQMQQQQWMFTENMAFQKQMNLIPVRKPDGSIVYVPNNSLGNLIPGLTG